MKSTNLPTAKKEVIVVFDIGKTHKKACVFDNNLQIVWQIENNFAQVSHPRFGACDPIEAIENWLLKTLTELQQQFWVQAVNFTTYGASFVHVHTGANPRLPLINYLLTIDAPTRQTFFSYQGNPEEFSRSAASPALPALLNSGLQLFWLQQQQLLPTGTISLHLPQYFYYLLTKHPIWEYSSLGCHTFLWNFDNKQYHSSNERFIKKYPELVDNSHHATIELSGHKVWVGSGQHDSTASLLPFVQHSKNPFILISTGTWCINMNPFNHSTLTNNELVNDCLLFLLDKNNSVKSSRFFMGHYHDQLLQNITQNLQAPIGFFKEIKASNVLLTVEADKVNEITTWLDEDKDLTAVPLRRLFSNYTTAYVHCMAALANCETQALRLIQTSQSLPDLIVTGGFVANELFLYFLQQHHPNQKILVAENKYSTPLGAALCSCKKMGWEIPKNLIKLYQVNLIKQNETK